MRIMILLKITMKFRLTVMRIMCYSLIRSNETPQTSGNDRHKQSNIFFLLSCVMRITVKGRKENMTQNNYQVSISNGNDKMGKIKSVSLPPIVTCPNWRLCLNAAGKHICYAERMYKNKKHGSVKRAWDRNLAILESDRDLYFFQVKAAAIMERFFRFHVSGDIIDQDYLHRMCKLARECKHTTFMAFTKNYKDVNAYFENHRQPKNLKIIFSLPFDNSQIENPHNLPTAAVILKGTTPADNWKICGGNCQECACRGVGCWELKKGETIAFDEH